MREFRGLEREGDEDRPATAALREEREHDKQRSDDVVERFSSDPEDESRTRSFLIQNRSLPIWTTIWGVILSKSGLTASHLAREGYISPVTKTEILYVGSRVGFRPAEV